MKLDELESKLSFLNEPAATKLPKHTDSIALAYVASKKGYKTSNIAKAMGQDYQTVNNWIRMAEKSIAVTNEIEKLRGGN